MEENVHIAEAIPENPNQSRANGPINAHLTIAKV